MRAEAVRTRLAPWDRAGRAAIVSAAAAVALGVLALASHHWDVSRFVTAGTDVTDPGNTPPGLYVAPGQGYDGQYMYRLALDPLTNRRTDFGITLDDAAYRQQRILYPTLAWFVSFGRDRWVPGALVAVNVVALAGLGMAGAALATSFGRHRLWGLAIQLYPGFALSLWRDLSEILAVLFVLAAVLALRRGRALPAALCLSAAVLTRETTVVLAVAGIVCIVWPVVGGSARTRPHVPWWTFAMPIACFASWQAHLRSTWGTLPLRSGRGSATFPLAAPVARIRTELDHLSASSVRLLLEIVLVLALLALGVARLRGSSLRPYEKLACVLYVALAAVLARDVWEDDWSFLRVLAEPVVFVTLGLMSRSVKDLKADVFALGLLWAAVLPSLSTRL